MAKTPRREGSDWQVGPTLKSKPDSQGTLFRGGSKFSAPGHWPNGYTPDRRDEVGEYMEDHNVVPNDYRQPHHVNQQQFNNVMGTIARSTVPTSHLNRVQVVVKGHADFRDDRNNLLHKMDRDNLLGLYHPPSRHRAENEKGQPLGRIQVRPGSAKDETLIHEIGHHRSQMTDTPHSRGFQTSSDNQGREEAYADDYAAEHYRNKKGKSEVQGVYPMSGRSTYFQEAYHGARRTPTGAEHPPSSSSPSLFSTIPLGVGNLHVHVFNQDAMPQRYGPDLH